MRNRPALAPTVSTVAVLAACMHLHACATDMRWHASAG